MRTLRWVGHMARMDETRLPRRLLTAWVSEFPNLTELVFSQELTGMRQAATCTSFRFCVLLLRFLSALWS